MCVQGLINCYHPCARDHCAKQRADHSLASQQRRRPARLIEHQFELAIQYRTCRRERCQSVTGIPSEQWHAHSRGCGVKWNVWRLHKPSGGSHLQNSLVASGKCNPSRNIRSLAFGCSRESGYSRVILTVLSNLDRTATIGAVSLAA
jgi:hypothetical protein